MMASSSVGIYDLPDEVLCEIFSKLTPEDVVKCAITVCKRWNDVIKENKVFWDHLQLTVHCDHFINYSYFNEESTNSNNSLQSLYPNELFIGEKDLEKVPTLRCIKLTEGSKAKSLPALLLIRILDIISKTCKNLEKFEFAQCFGATSKEFFQFLRERYSHISEVRFGVNCTYIIPYSEISRLGNITTLVSHDYAFKRSDLNLLADSCETLSCVWILFTRSVKVDDILYFLDKKKNALKELGLGMNLQDCILEKLKECHRLEVLFATDARYVTDVCIKSFNNLPRLKYCSLHGAVFELETVWGMVKADSSGISTQLIILDLTGYKYRKQFVTSIFQEEELMKRFKESKSVVFDNDVNTAISIPWFSKSSFHWMYRSKLVLKDFKFWKNMQNYL